MLVTRHRGEDRVAGTRVVEAGMGDVGQVRGEEAAGTVDVGFPGAAGLRLEEPRPVRRPSGGLPAPARWRGRSRAVLPGRSPPLPGTVDAIAIGRRRGAAEPRVVMMIPNMAILSWRGLVLWVPGGGRCGRPGRGPSRGPGRVVESREAGEPPLPVACVPRLACPVTRPPRSRPIHGLPPSCVATSNVLGETQRV